MTDFNGYEYKLPELIQQKNNRKNLQEVIAMKKEIAYVNGVVDNLNKYMCDGASNIVREFVGEEDIYDKNLHSLINKEYKSDTFIVDVLKRYVNNKVVCVGEFCELEEGYNRYDRSFGIPTFILMVINHIGNERVVDIWIRKEEVYILPFRYEYRVPLDEILDPSFYDPRYIESSVWDGYTYHFMKSK